MAESRPSGSDQRCLRTVRSSSSGRGPASKHQRPRLKTCRRPYPKPADRPRIALRNAFRVVSLKDDHFRESGVDPVRAAGPAHAARRLWRARDLAPFPPASLMARLAQARRPRPTTIGAVAALASYAAGVLGFASDAAELEFFEKRIRPVLVEHCYECHAVDSKSVRGGLLVDSAGALRVGGDSGPAVVAGEPDESLLLSALRHESFEMPPSGALPKEVIADFELWIQRGAIDPREADPAAGRESGAVDADEARSHWAFQPIRDTPVPDPALKDWPETDVDRFVLAGLESAGLSPAPDADRRTLLRRVWFDLVGLPPPVDAIDAFLADPRPTRGALAGVVDELLASPRFGERWGRHWLDVARYRRLDRRWALAVVRGELALPRLRDRRRQQRQAVRPLRLRAAGRRPAAARRPPPARRTTGRDRAARARADQLRAAGQRAVADGRCGRADRHGRPRLSRDDARLRAVPRSQVRPGEHRGVLRVGRDLPQHQVVDPRQRVGVGHPAAAPAARRAGSPRPPRRGDRGSRGGHRPTHRGDRCPTRAAPRDRPRRRRRQGARGPLEREQQRVPIRGARVPLRQWPRRTDRVSPAAGRAGRVRGASLVHAARQPLGGRRVHGRSPRRAKHAQG